MNDRHLVALSALVGALAGALTGFLLFTDRGKRLRAEVRPHVDGLFDEVVKLGESVQRAKASIIEGWQGAEEPQAHLDEPGSPWSGASGGAQPH